MLRNSFLENLNPVDRKKDWYQLVPGRVGILTLRGKHGTLDLVVAYLASGSDAAQDRITTIRAVAHHIRPRNKTLTIMTGDWNFAFDKRDRFCKSRAEWTGTTDHDAAECWLQHLQAPHHLCELEQPQFTHENDAARSRIDRIYTNHYASDQLDRHFSCTALPWTPLSAHRPISFARATPQRGQQGNRRLPQGPIQHADWPRRVALEFHNLASQDANGGNPIRRLVLIKRAIHTVTKNMQRENLIAEAEEVDDQLGWTMALIRAAETINLTRMRRCVQGYPHLSSFLNPDDPNARTQHNMEALRNHAIDLVRSSINDKVSKLKQQNMDDTNSLRSNRLKENIMTQLTRIAPGSTMTINALRTQEGKITTDPTEVAEALRKHWGRVFKDLTSIRQT